MPEVWVMICSTVTAARRCRVTGPGPSAGRWERMGSSGVRRPSSMTERTMVVQMSLLTEARSNQVSGVTSPTVHRYKVSVPRKT